MKGIAVHKLIFLLGLLFSNIEHAILLGMEGGETGTGVGFPSEGKEDKLFDFARVTIDYGTTSRRGTRRKGKVIKENEDRYNVFSGTYDFHNNQRDDIFFAGVYDGHGGGEVSEYLGEH